MNLPLKFEDDYISFEISKLLKQTSFDEECVFHWFLSIFAPPRLELNYIIRKRVACTYYKNSSFQSPAPTWTMFFNWLEGQGMYVHDYHLENDTYGADLYTKEGELIYSRAVKREPWPLGFPTRLEAWNNISIIALKLLNEST
jgi:hypothetical protein